MKSTQHRGAQKHIVNREISSQVYSSDCSSGRMQGRRLGLQPGCLGSDSGGAVRLWGHLASLGLISSSDTQLPPPPRRREDQAPSRCSVLSCSR